MTPATDRRTLARDLRAIVGDGCAFSVMVGAGETYLAAFALAMGMGEIAAGLIAAVPILGGALLQIVSPWAVARLGSHKRWVVTCAAAQSVTFVPLVIGAWMGMMPVAALFAVATLYWASGMGTGPAWNTWVGTLVPDAIRARFFAARTRLAQCAVLLGVVGGGLALHLGAAHGRQLAVFAALFAVAGIARGVSAGFLASQSEPEPIPAGHRTPSLAALRRGPRGSAGGRLLLYMVAVQGALQISGPYFTPYMLEQLDFSYATYLVLIATSFAAKMTALPAIGRLANRIGSQRVLYIAGAGIVPTAGLWIISGDFWYLLAIQVLAGAVWAAYELATFLLLFERIPPAERTSVLTLFNVAHATATVGGAVFGAAVLGLLGTDPKYYFLLFGLSSLARLAALPLLLRVHPRDVRGTVLPRPLAVRPNAGSVDAPLVAAMEDGTGAEPER